MQKINAYPGRKSHPEYRAEALPSYIRSVFLNTIGGEENTDIRGMCQAIFEAIDSVLPSGYSHDGDVSDPVVGLRMDTPGLNCRGRAKIANSLASMRPDVNRGYKVRRMPSGAAHVSNVFWQSDGIEAYEFDNSLFEDLDKHTIPLLPMYNPYAVHLVGGEVTATMVSVLTADARSPSVVEGGDFLARMVPGSNAESLISFVATGSLGELIVGTKGLTHKLLC